MQARQDAGGHRSKTFLRAGLPSQVKTNDILLRREQAGVTKGISRVVTELLIIKMSCSYTCPAETLSPNMQNMCRNLDAEITR